MKKLLKSLVPESIKQKVRDNREKNKEENDMNALPEAKSDVSNLKFISQDELDSIFTSEETAAAWESVQADLKGLNLPEMTGGVNPGDQRAIFSLIYHFKPETLLEVGTLIGCSTTNISLALRSVGNPNTKMTSVDINDVNSPELKLYERYGSAKPPRDLVAQLGYGDNVHFHTQSSIDFLAETDKKFDFIFLDGSHDASIVYQEIPKALKCLNPNGVILLHDYFPDNKPVWSNNSVIPGPFWAAERLRKVDNNFHVKPLGALPWPTKLDSNITSLAVMSANQS